MKNYRPGSWSEIARKFANRIYIQVVDMYENGETAEYYDFEGNLYENVDPEKWGRHVFETSYRHPRVRLRAAGIFGRKIKEYKKRKNL